MRFIDESLDELFGSRRYIAAFYVCTSLILVVFARFMLARGFDERVVLWVGAVSVLPLHFLAYGLMRVFRVCLRALIRTFAKRLVWIVGPQGAQIPAPVRTRMAYATARAAVTVLVFLISSFSSAAANLFFVNAVNARRVLESPHNCFYVSTLAVVTQAACLTIPFLSLLFALDWAGRAPKIVRDYEQKALAYSYVALEQARARTATLGSPEEEVSGQSSRLVSITNRQ